MSYKDELQKNNTDLQEILTKVNSLPNAGGNGGINPSGTKQITENGTYDVTHYASAEVNVPQAEMPETVEQATPVISVSSSGKITATTNQSEGYVVGGTKTATKQLTTKGATTITPSSSIQTAVLAGTYVTGDIIVAAAPSGGDNGGGSGGLPDGMLAIDSGTYIPSGDKTSKIKINHNMGIIPDFVVIHAPSENVDADCLYYQAINLDTYTSSSGTTYYGAILTRYINGSSGSRIYSNSTLTSNRDYTNEYFYIYCNSTQKLRSGIEYKWVVGKFA